MDSWEKLFRKKSKNGQASFHTEEPANTTGLREEQRSIPIGSNGTQESQTKKLKSLPAVLEKIQGSLDDIWSNIYLETNKRPETLLLCGAKPGEGCTFISFYLCLFLALVHNMKVLYVDTKVNVGDNSCIIPDIKDRPGLASYFADGHSLSSLVLSTQYENLFVLPSGFKRDKTRTKDKNIIFDKQAVESLLEYCRDRFHITIFDGQPIVFSPVMIGLAKAVGQVVLVCRYGYSRREVTRLAIDKLRKNNISVIGVILNDREYPIPPKIYKKLK